MKIDRLPSSRQEIGGPRLLSRNGHRFASFSALAESISDSLPNLRAVIDGEICSLDRRGRPQFKNLLFRRGNPPCFFAFDLLTSGGDRQRVGYGLSFPLPTRSIFPCCEQQPEREA